MSVCIESLKQMNLVDFLTDHYGLHFTRSGSGYVASSPFGEDRRPSFFVRMKEGRWLFKDFSSGLGGSIIDLVQHLEGLSGLGRVFRRIEQLVGGRIASLSPSAVDADVERSKGRGYDIDELYQRFLREDSDACRRYLLGRGIDPELVEGLIADGEVVHNRYKGKSYCCFAVRDAAGALRCLDNHEIEGGGKFVLGAKSVFSRDWPEFAEATEAFVSEGIIDYLSIKTLEGGSLPGIALLGNQLIFDAALFAGVSRIIAAFDKDRGGISAFVDLMERYPDKELSQYPLGGHEDPNELLQARGGKKARLTAGKKLELYRAFQRRANKSELAREWGIDRSHMYEVVHDCEELLLDGLTGRQPGRPPTGRPGTVKEAWLKIGQLQEENERLSLERDKSCCREEFLRLRLKWSEIEASELRGEPVDEEKGPGRKSQIKKKRKRRRLR